MSTDAPSGQQPTQTRRRSKSAQAFFRGLAITLPPILTIVILIWAGQLIYGYVVYPTSKGVQWTIAQFIRVSRPTRELLDWERLPALQYCGRDYRIPAEYRRELEQTVGADPKAVLRSGDVDPARVFVPVGDRSRAIPYRDYVVVAAEFPPHEMPRSVTGFYMEIVTRRHFKGLFHLSAVAVLIAIVLVYFIGRFVTARIGAWAVHKVETSILGRMPIISNVYGSVKQVTDFFLTERTVEYNRVVAVEYPRRGIWSIGFVTGDSMLEMTAAAGEPLLAVLMPTSPMPMTGFTVSVPRSEVLDLNITVDQAFQFCLSCGVLVPPQQAITPELLQQELAKRFSSDSVDGGRAGRYRRSLPAAAAPPSPPAGRNASAAVPEAPPQGDQP